MTNAVINKIFIIVDSNLKYITAYSSRVKAQSFIEEVGNNFLGNELFITCETVDCESITDYVKKKQLEYNLDKAKIK